MRIFDSRTWRIKAVRFQDCKAFLDDILASVGRTAAGVAMYANHLSETALSRLKKAYAPLTAYVNGGDGLYTMTSLRGDRVHIDAAHESVLWALVKATPRSVPVTHIGVMLDGIGWDGTPPAAMEYRPAPNGGLASFYGCYSNHIAVRRYEAKSIAVELMIERFTDGETLSPLPSVFQAISQRLGAPERQERFCLFDAPQEAVWKDASQALRRDAAAVRYEDAFAEFLNNAAHSAREQIERLPTELKPLVGFSPKAVLLQAAKPYGLQFETGKHGEYRFHKTTAYGHRLEFVVTIPPMTSYVFMKAYAHGWNMEVSLGGTPQATVFTAQALATYADRAFAVAATMETCYTERLYRTFGATPPWFWE